jgi:deazaflavin-dependent oxidoreductase (nitroreductase family)
MPMPRWWGQINKRVFNPRELERGMRPVVTHVGRTSGRTYRTPLDAHPVDGGYLFVLVYGSKSDWVRNVLAAGHADLTIDGEDVGLTTPRLVGEDEALAALPPSVKRPPRLLRITEYLRMDVDHMATLAAAAAGEADRLVLGVNASRDHDRLARLAADVGVGEWHLLGHWWDFLLAGRLTRDLALLRTRYWPAADVDALMDRLLRSELVREQDGHLVATERLTPVLHAFLDESLRVARHAWADHDHLVDVVATGAARMIAAADETAHVAVAHRQIPLPENPSLALYCRLVTVRYVRQHDHAAAWAAHGLTAAEMRVYTALWAGESVAEDAPGRDGLEARELVVRGGGLTEAGRALRDQIEQETLRRSARTYDALGPDGPAYLAAITALPTPGTATGTR